jgi:hypothetical protein
MNLRELKQLIGTVIQEEELKHPRIYEAYCFLANDPEVNVLDVLTYVRALRGVTIVSLKEATKKITANKETAIVRIKFQPTGLTTRPYMKTLEKEIRKIPGVISFHYKSVERLS